MVDSVHLIHQPRESLRRCRRRDFENDSVFATCTHSLLEIVSPSTLEVVANAHVDFQRRNPSP